MQQRKLLFFIAYLMVFSVISFRMKTSFFPDIDPIFIFFQTVLFATIFGAFTWHDAISQIYHLYMRFTKRVAAKNIVLALVAQLFLVAILYIGIGGISRFSPVILIIDPFLFSLAFLLIYFWIDALSFGDFFSGTILFVANASIGSHSSSWLQDPHSKKTVVRIDPRGVGTRELEELIVSKKINEIVLFKPDFSEERLAEIKRFLSDASIGYFIITSEEFWNRDGSYNLDCLFRGYTNRDSLLNVSLKRVFDLVFSSLMLFLLAPIFLLLAVLILAEDGGPVFYISHRVGKNGRLIKFYKFRSMVVNAEKLKSQLAELNERSGGPLFKMRNDPRVTRIGRILRKYSLDELPQLFNVLRGTLSLVGPRPHLVSEAQHYKGFDFQRLDCIPGITCIAQITDRNGLSFEDWIALDLKYRSQWSFVVDFLILAKTVGVVLRPVVLHLKGHRVDAY